MHLAKIMTKDRKLNRYVLYCHFGVYRYMCFIVILLSHENYRHMGNQT